jgi:hypothetical protein
MATRTATRRDASSGEAAKRRPAHTIRYGSLKASIWRQESDKGPWYSTVLTRTYRDDAGNWQSSDSYGRDELLLLAKLANDANSWIWRQRAKDAAAAGGGLVDEGEEGPDQANDIHF